MNWIKENKFLTGFFAVLALGAGALGYLLYTARNHYEEVNGNYLQQSAELHRLRTLPLFPNAENLAKMEDQKREHLGKIEELQKSLLSMQLPVEPTTPEQFQDKLRASVDAYAKQAMDAGMQLPAKFFMGFDQYEAKPPKVVAAPLLGRELNAIELVLNQLPSHGVMEIKGMTRDELPEESSGAAKPEPPKPAAGRMPGADGTEKALLNKHAFEVDFISARGAAQVVLNSITSNQQQFFIPRMVVIRNEKDKGPSRVDPNAAAPVPTPAPPSPLTPRQPTNPTAPPAPPAEPPVQIIVGDEKVETTLRVEIVDFVDVTPKQPTAAK